MSLNWKSHLDSLTTRVRKIIIIFKTEVICRLLYFKNSLVYYALCKSTFTYCISIWGAAPKKLLILYILPLERTVLKITTFKPFRYPIPQLYEDCVVLTEFFFVLHTWCAQRNRIKGNNTKSRRSFNVYPTNKCYTATAQRHFILSVVIFVIINLIKYATYFLFPYIYEKQKLVCFTSPSLQ